MGHCEHVLLVFFTTSSSHWGKDHWVTSQERPCNCCYQRCVAFLIFQAAEKEAALTQQEEEKAEQRKRARAEKKALKKKKKTRGGDKRKADEGEEKEWGDDEEGKACQKCSQHRRLAEN